MAGSPVNVVAGVSGPRADNSQAGSVHDPFHSVAVAPNEAAVRSADGIARTSQADIARRGGSVARTVRNAIKGLERRGLLKVVHRGGLNRGPSVYRPFGIPPD